MARAALAALRERAELVAGAAAEIDALIEEPPGEEKRQSRGLSWAGG